MTPHRSKVQYYYGIKLHDMPLQMCQSCITWLKRCTQGLSLGPRSMISKSNKIRYGEAIP
jgi:hypothetical protein